jgi:hypothetical protein
MSDSSLYYPDTPSTDSDSSTDAVDTPRDLYEEGLSGPAPYPRLAQSEHVGTHRYRSRQLIHSPSPPLPKSISACLVDPFSTLPLEVDPTTNQLLHFYGQDSYWATAYALSPKIKPSIKGSWEYQAGACLTHFHILMARSALHQLRMNGDQYGSQNAKKDLEYAALKHQTKAITVLRENVSLGQAADMKLILTSIISLATFEQRYGDPKRAALHFKTGRDIIRQIGMHDTGLNDRLREEQALWFEGIYTDPGASWLWGKEDANARLGWLKNLLKEVDRMWRDRQLLPLAEKSQGYVPAISRLHEFLFRETLGRNVSVYGDIDDCVAQQRCILIFVSIMCGIYDELTDNVSFKAISKATMLSSTIRAYATFINDLAIQHDLGPSQAVADILWMMCQNYRDVKPHLVAAVPAHARPALEQLDLKDCHWRASGIANVVKYLPESRQLSLRDLLLRFVDGKPYTGKVRVNEFEFSYVGVS